MKRCALSFPIILLSLSLITCGKSGHKWLFSPDIVSNTEPRRDTIGRILDAHDGCLQFFNGRYYLYGTAYGTGDGFGTGNRYRVYSSPDLVDWEFQGELLQGQPEGVYYRPYVVFNTSTGNYVLWYNWYPELWKGHIGVAVSASPTGPFSIVKSSVTLSQSAYDPGDGSLFVDRDGSGYFIYTVIGAGHAIRIEKLTNDYLGSAGAVSPVLGTGSEAPVMFRNGNVYYALFDTCCCFCREGSGARVFTASAPLGPYVERGNINRGTDRMPTIPAQQTWIAHIPALKEWVYIWMGDRWGSNPDGVKGHDFQYWSAPLRFTASGDILPMKNGDEWIVPAR
jgi:hypothetical protein